MIHIADTKIARRYGDYFIRQINKIEEVGRIYASFFKHIKRFSVKQFNKNTGKFGKCS